MEAYCNSLFLDLSLVYIHVLVKTFDRVKWGLFINPCHLCYMKCLQWELSTSNYDFSVSLHAESSALTCFTCTTPSALPLMIYAIFITYSPSSSSNTQTLKWPHYHVYMYRHVSLNLLQFTLVYVSSSSNYSKHSFDLLCMYVLHVYM